MRIVAARVDARARLHGHGPARRHRARPRQRGRRAPLRLGRRARRARPHPDARRHRRQPQRVGRGRRPALRGPAAAVRRDRLTRSCTRHTSSMDVVDFIIIGAGPAGEAAAYKARERGASVAIVDRQWFGGSCPHIGCLPSKALLHSAAEHHANPATYSWQRASAHRDYMVNRPADAAEPDDSGHFKRLVDAGAIAYRGSARIVGRGRVEVRHDDQVHELHGRNVLVAVGSFSKKPPVPGLDAIDTWTNRQATLARELPKSLLVLGGGPTGCEMAQVYARFDVPDRDRPVRRPARADRPSAQLPGGPGGPPGIRRRGPARCPGGRRAGRSRHGRRARDRSGRRLDRGGPRDPARRRARLPARGPRARALRHRHVRANARLPARRPAPDRRRAVGHRRPGRARAPHPPGPLPGRAGGPDGARRRRHARLPRAYRGRSTRTPRPRSSA